MRLKEIRKKEEGNFINRYDLVYEINAKKQKVYEIISRHKGIKSFDDLKGDSPDAVVIIATNAEGDKILINREFRMAVNGWVYNFPAGLIEPGELPKESARRELQEETGLELYEIDDYIGTSYSAVGFSNEINVCVVGKARGSFQRSSSPEEEIIPGWYTREEVRSLLKNERFAARTQAYCYLWSKGSS